MRKAASSHRGAEPAGKQCQRNEALGLRRPTSSPNSAFASSIATTRVAQLRKDCRSAATSSHRGTASAAPAGAEAISLSNARTVGSRSEPPRPASNKSITITLRLPGHRRHPTPASKEAQNQGRYRATAPRAPDDRRSCAKGSAHSVVRPTCGASSCAPSTGLRIPATFWFVYNMTAR